MRKCLISGVTVLLLSLLAVSTVFAQSLQIIDDAESGHIDNWSVFDTDPEGHEIVSVIDESNRYLAFTSTGTKNGFRIGGRSLTTGGLDLRDLTFASFRLRTNSGFNIAFLLETSAGLRRMRYSHASNSAALGAATVVTKGLARASYNGSWNTYSVNLQADVQEAQPEVSIIAVHGVEVRGTVDLDDIFLFEPSSSNPAPVANASGEQIVEPGKQVDLEGSASNHEDRSIVLWRWTDDQNKLLSNSARLSIIPDGYGRRTYALTVIDDSGAQDTALVDVTVRVPMEQSRLLEDGEQGDTRSWRVRDRTPEGYRLFNVDEDGNRFIRFQGTDRLNSFIAGDSRSGRADSLEINDLPAVSWRMRAESPYNVYFIVDTSDGLRYLTYNSARPAAPVDKTRSVVTGLGSSTYDGQWHLFNRNLQSDLQSAQPGNQLLAINGVLLRGSLDMDDLVFLDDTFKPQLSMPRLLSPAEGQHFASESTVRFSWQVDDVATNYQFELAALETGFDSPLATAQMPAGSCGATCVVAIDMPSDSPGLYVWRLRASDDYNQTAWVESTINMTLGKPARPVNLTPAIGIDINTASLQRFTWAFDPIVETYEFHFFDRVNSTTLDYFLNLDPQELCTPSVCSFETQLTLPIGNNHAWRVRGSNVAGKSDWSRSTFNVTDIVIDPPPAPELNSPLAQAMLEAGSTIAFAWQKVETASAYEFELLQPANGSVNSINAFVPDSTCESTICALAIPVDLPVANDYQWQVRARNAAGSSAWVQRNVAVIAAATQKPITPVNISPDSKAKIAQGREVEFVWQHDSHALTYEFHIFDNVAKNTTPYVVGLKPADICTKALCKLTQTLTQPVATNHAWRVRGRNSLGASEWSRTIFDVIDVADPDPGNLAPEASFAIAGFEGDASGNAPLTLSLDPTASSDDEGIISYEWSFGDVFDDVTRTQSTTVTHTFSEAGEYLITLNVKDAEGLSAQTQKKVSVFLPPDSVADEDAARLLAQATFGTTRADINKVKQLGIENWIDWQFTQQGASQLDYVLQYSNGSGRAPRHEIWWASAIDGEDQLRQRVAFALSQLLVVSDTGYTLANAQYGVTGYYQMLLDSAFTNYRDVLEKVTLSPVMGLYLSMLQNGKSDMAASTRADENFAREVLQLFSIGLHQLDGDGSTDGRPVFTQDHIEHFARVFTGWNYADAGRWDRPLFTGADMISPMEPFEEYHDVEQKILLGGEVVPAGLSARADLERALNNIFNHPNVGPFVGKHLITQLVTSNPSPQYVSRITSVFNNDGKGVRGNLKAVIKAILMDEEARTIPSFNAYGKLREPILRFTHLWRAFGVLPGSQSDEGRHEYNTISPQLMDLELVTGQAVLKSPSVFNFFQPSFAPSGVVADQKLKAPEFELFTESNELATSNRIGRQIQQYSVASISAAAHPVSFLDFTYEVDLAIDVDVLLHHLNIILMSGQMPDELRNALRSHLNELPDTEDGKLRRVRDAVTLIMASPDYLVQM